MLHPDQFQPDEAWIAFQLNIEPIRVGADGAFNVFALMDAASCFMLSSQLVACGQQGPTSFEARRLFVETQAHTKGIPLTLFIPEQMDAAELVLHAEREKVVVVRVPEDQLLVFIGPARRSFREQFGRQTSD